MKQNELLLLSLLVSKDRYAYELEKLIDDTQMRTWSEIGFSSVYAVLKGLAEEEYISFSYEKEPGSPRRKVYHLEAKGEEALKQGVLECITSPRPIYPDLHVGVILSENILTPAEYREALEEYRDRLLAFAEGMKWEGGHFVRTKKGVAAVYRRMQLRMEADLNWLEEELEKN